MKILLIGEYSGLHNELKNALITLGHDVTLAAGTDVWKGFSSDINLGHGSNIYTYKIRQFLLPIVHIKKFQNYDVVHLINFYTIPRSPYLNHLFIKYLKENNRIVTMSGAGDDPFFVKYCSMTLKYNPVEPHEKYDRNGPYYIRGAQHLRSMHNSMTYIDAIIPIMYEYYSTFIAAGYSGKTTLPVPIPININNIKYIGASSKRQKILFFHGLNRPGFKGTHLIERCFLELTSRYPSDVECLIKGHIPFKDYLDFISRVDVAVDQVFSYSLAMNALYSMAQGKVVIGGAEEESSILYDGEIPPVYNALPDFSKFMEVFEQIMDERHLLTAKGVAGRNFVGEFHSPQKIATKYIEIWKNI